MNADAEHDARWADDMNSISENHAKIINSHISQIDQMSKMIRDMRNNFNDVVAQVVDNDDRVNNIVEDNDTQTKAQVEDNDKN